MRAHVRRGELVELVRRGECWRRPTQRLVTWDAHRFVKPADVHQHMNLGWTVKR